MTEGDVQVFILVLNDMKVLGLVYIRMTGNPPRTNYQLGVPDLSDIWSTYPQPDLPCVSLDTRGSGPTWWIA
jgi:hypothetical protein